MFFLSYDFLLPDEDTAFRDNEALRVEDVLELIDLTQNPGEATEVFGTDGDDLVLGSEASETIHGGAGADILIGGDMTLADLAEAGFLSDAQVESLSVPVEPVGDLV